MEVSVQIEPFSPTQEALENEDFDSLRSDAHPGNEYGIALFDNNLQLLSWNQDYFNIQELPGGLADRMRPLADFVRFWIARENISLGRAERQALSIIDQASSAQPYRHAWKRQDGRTVNTLIAPIYGGGVMSVCSVENSAEGAEQSDPLSNFLLQHAAPSTRIDVLDSLDRMIDGFALFDSEDRLVFCNKRYRDLAANHASSLLPGTKFASILQAGFESGDILANSQTPEELYKQHKRAVRGDISSYEISLSDNRWISCNETRTNDGSTISIRSDITEQKEREAELTQLSAALKVQNLHFDTALNNMVQGLCLFDADQRMIVCNKRYLDIFGFSADVVKPGIMLREIMEYSVSLGNYSSENATAAVKQRPAHAENKEVSELEQWLSDGRVISVLHQPMPGGGSVATYEEITDRKRDEERLKRHADELEKRNQELQVFAYVASHDLQEPLRKIEAFGGRLKKKYSDKIGTDGQQYLERMDDAARRMRQLIEDLLAYSRVTERGGEFEPCDLNNVLEGVLSDLEIRITETGATIDADTLPTISAAPILMRQLLQNIIGNSLKFVADGKTPVTRVACRDCKLPHPDNPRKNIKAIEIEITDNGIGFEQKYADQIFGIFQRLHGRTEFDGTGIGLATCRRIIEGHGGEIQAVGRPDEGATFLIRLPVTPPI
jgi:signal transduction histidine kinase